MCLVTHPMDANTMKHEATKQSGFSLIELMISVVAGLIVVGGVTSVYLSTIKSSAETLRHAKLNQELSALMQVMANDIRRAGIWQGTSVDYENPQNNPFSSPNNTKLTVVTSSGTTVDPFNTSTWPTIKEGSCILYAYDRPIASALGTVENTDILGFKLATTNSWGYIQIRSSGVATGTDNDLCSTGTWGDLTDPNLIDIDELTFNIGDSACINVSEPNQLDDDGDSTVDEDQERDCYDVPPSSGDITTETRQVKITVVGSLVSDASVKRTIEQTVRVRNDHVEVH